MHQLVIEMDTAPQAERFLMQKMANLSDAFGKRA